MSGAGGVVPVVTILDYLKPEINRPDLYAQKAYPMPTRAGSSQSSKSIQIDKADDSLRSPIISLYYTVGLIVLSAAIFITLSAWANALLSWLDSIYVSPVINSVTRSRVYFATIVTGISLIVIALLLFIWYEFTINRGV